MSDTTDPSVPAQSTGPSATPTAGAPAPQPPRRRRTGLIIGLIGGGVVLVGAIVAVLLLVVLPLFAPRAEAAGRIVDILTEPSATWSYDYLGGQDAAYIGSPSTAEVGDDAALIWSSFDLYTFQSDNGGAYSNWYEGYDADYQAGYDAGVAYKTAYDAYLADETYTSEYPDYETYVPADSAAGFTDGFYDSPYYEGTFGANKSVKPVEPDFVPSLTLVNLTSGDATWTIDLADLAGADYNSSVSSSDIDGSAYGALEVSSDEKAGIYTLDRKTGAQVAEYSVDIPAPADDAETSVFALTPSYTTYEGDLFILTPASETESTLARYAPSDLETPKWESTVGGGYGVYRVGDNLVVSGLDSSDIIDPATGEPVEQESGLDPDSSYLPVGDATIRYSYDDDRTTAELMAVDADGKDLWDAAITADSFNIGDDALYTYDVTTTDDDTTYSGLQRIDLASGKTAWKAAWDGPFSQLVFLRSDRMIAYDDSSVHLLNPADGEEIRAEKVGTVNRFVVGEALYYAVTDGDLTALRWEEKGDVWSYNLTDGESIVRIGDHLYLLNVTAGTLSGLSAT